MSGPIDMERKGYASLRFWILYMTLTVYPTYDLDFGQILK